jgi:glycosyltransferase involved in cell wall biosynthesis
MLANRETTDAPAAEEPVPLPTATDRRYRYAMISSEIRRDLQEPLSRFQQLEIYHFYRTAPWNDMKPEEFDERTVRFRLPFDLFQQLMRVKPDIVQGPEPLSLLMLPYLTATLLYLWLNPRVKLVTLSLEPIPLGRKYHPLLVPFFRLILFFWFRRASVIFWFDSGSQRNLLANGAPPNKLVHQIYGSWGLDPDEFSPAGPAVPVERAAPDEPVVLYVGRLSPVKGVTYLIDAFRLLLDRGVRAHLAIVGDGPERARLEDQARRLGLAERVTWFGTVKNADLPPYMRAADFLVLPSITTKLWVQQLSMTAWQAMGCGLPVISTQTGCMDEFTPPEVGILVPERDPVSLADAMAALLTDRARRDQMAADARAYALRRFDARRNVEAAERTILERCQ